MYRKLLPSLFLICCAFASSAQSTLTPTNFNPQIGDIFAIVNCDTAGVTQGPGGANQTWNFTSLVTASLDTSKAVSCLSTTPNCSAYPGSTLAVVSPPSDLVVYLMANSSKLSQVGFYEPDTTLVFSDPEDEIRFPFTYPNSFLDTFTGVLTVGGLSAIENGTVSVVCDGYGTLMLPGGIVDTGVLRVHSTQVFTDSTHLLDTSVIETYNISTYTWYMPNFHNALLTINFAILSGAASASYELVSYSPRQLGVAGVAVVHGISSSLKLFPNPVQNELNIAFEDATDEQVQISLVDILGREVAVIGNGPAQTLQHVSYNTTGLPQGLYLVRLESEHETITRKIEIR